MSDKQKISDIVDQLLERSIALAEQASKEGLLSLVSEFDEYDPNLKEKDIFLYGLQCIVDGSCVEDIVSGLAPLAKNGLDLVKISLIPFIYNYSIALSEEAYDANYSK